MDRALMLAERGRGRTSPNPLVGAVIVSPCGVVVGQGAHEFAGGPHAEVRALDAAGDRARDATLYCTLEPCCHTGRTGPCVARIVEAGLRRVVASTSDPNPLVAGKGFAFLQSHGIDVAVGVRESAARALNQPFFTLIAEQRPFVIAKAAISADGMIAATPGARDATHGSRRKQTRAAGARRDRRDRRRVGNDSRRRSIAHRARCVPRAPADAGDFRPPVADACIRPRALDSHCRACHHHHHRGSSAACRPARGARGRGRRGGGCREREFCRRTDHPRQPRHRLAAPRGRRDAAPGGVGRRPYRFRQVICHATQRSAPMGCRCSARPRSRRYSMGPTRFSWIDARSVWVQTR